MGAPLISIQLYSGRHFPPVESQLAAVQRAGFTTVETFAPFHEDVGETLRLFQKYGLAAKSGHFSLAMAEQEHERVVAIAKALGMKFVVIPYLPPEDLPTDVAGWAAIGRRLKAISDRLGPHGLRVAWHNHDFEFVRLDDRSHPIEHLLGADLLWEADLAWAFAGGSDPAYWLEKYRGRVPLVHVKDIANESMTSDVINWADVGTGILSWAHLWRLSIVAGAEIMIAEHDNPSDFERFARVSGAAMRDYAEGSSVARALPHPA